MRVIITSAAIFAFTLVAIALLNLYILFESGNCKCVGCPGACIERSKVEQLECTQEDSKLDCTAYSCRDIFGRCTKVPKLLEFNTYIRTY
jgi:hypothetical protein